MCCGGGSEGGEDEDGHGAGGAWELHGERLRLRWREGLVVLDSDDVGSVEMVGEIGRWVIEEMGLERLDCGRVFDSVDDERL